MGYITGKRERIIEFLESNSSSSFTLEEICRGVLTDGKGRSTVYRLVSELVSDGAVRRLSDGRTRHCTYQFLGGDGCHRHMHLKCKDCGRLIHLDEALSHELEERLVAAGGFEVEEGMVIYGRCSECKYEGACHNA